MKKLRIMLVAAVSILLVTLAVMSISATKWTDVPDDAWYTSAVVKANELGVMNGTSDTTFAPLKNLSRAEYVAILFRLAEGEANLPFTFTDVPADAWYAQYVGWAEQAGVITGYGNAETFGGTALITREQLMLMTSRFMDYMGIGFANSNDAVEFGDADKISSWAAIGVEATRKAALITGDANGKFNPQAPATRAEIATIVVRYMNKLPEAKDAMYVKFENILDYVEKDEKGKVTFKEPVAGNNVETTIDINLQIIAEDALAKIIDWLKNPEDSKTDKNQELVGRDVEGAAVVVMKVKTGEVLACASYPTYNPQTYNEDYNDILEADFDPLFRGFPHPFGQGSDRRRYRQGPGKPCIPAPGL